MVAHHVLGGRQSISRVTNWHEKAYIYSDYTPVKSGGTALCGCLAVPRNRYLQISKMGVHAGVTCTLEGIRIFRMDKIYYVRPPARIPSYTYRWDETLTCPPERIADDYPYKALLYGCLSRP